MSAPTDHSDDGDARRVRAVRGGPVLIEGPVEIELAGGAAVRSDRFVVAVCACGRSRGYPVRHQSSTVPAPRVALMRLCPSELTTRPAERRRPLS